MGVETQPVFQFLATTAAMLNVLSGGMHYGWSSPSLPKLLSNDSDIPLTPNEATWIASAIMIGDACGACITLFLLDRLGRKTVILCTIVPFIVAWIFIAFAKSFAVLFVGRILAGIGDGSTYSSVPIYIGEISEPRFRGLLGSGVAVVWIAGTLIMNIMGSYLATKTSALLSITIPVITFLTFIWMPDSPYYSVMKNSQEKARNSLTILRGNSNVDEELSRISLAIQQRTSIAQKFIDLFTVHSNRRALFVMLGIRGLQQACGVTVIVLYAQILFKEGDSTISAQTSSSIYFALFLIVTGLCSLIVDKTGRKPLLLISVCGSFLALVLVSTYFYIHNKTDIDTSNLRLLPTIGLFCYVAFFSIGLQGIPTLFLGELFSTSVKPVAVCVSIVWFAIVVTTISKGFQLTREMYGVHIPFFIFSAFCIVTFLFIINIVPETKGKTLEEIQKNFNLRINIMKKR